MVSVVAINPAGTSDPSARVKAQTVDTRWKIDGVGPSSMTKSIYGTGSTGYVRWTISDPYHALKRFEIEFATNTWLFAPINEGRSYPLSPKSPGVTRTQQGWTINIWIRYRQVTPYECWKSNFYGDTDSLALYAWRDNYSDGRSARDVKWRVTCYS
jgi:hypothetical protein